MIDNAVYAIGVVAIIVLLVAAFFGTFYLFSEFFKLRKSDASAHELIHKHREDYWDLKRAFDDHVRESKGAPK